MHCKSTAADLAALEHPTSSYTPPAGFPKSLVDEMRHPLASIAGFAELFESTELTTQQRDYASAIGTAAARLSQLLSEFGMTILPTPYDGPAPSGTEDVRSPGRTVRSVLNQTVAALAARAHQRRIEILSDIAGDDGPIHVDENGLSNVLINLLSNAVDHSRGRRVRLHAVQIKRLHGPDAYRFAVSDDGGSLDPQHASRLFEASTDTCRGLPASQEWVNRHGGQIEVAVDPGTSTTFWFDIPVAHTCNESAA